MGYHIEETELPGVLILTPRVFEDERGFFFESFNQQDFDHAIGSSEFVFVQDNHSRSKKGTLRGLHFQNPHPQGKLVRVVCGSVFDVVVDIRRSSNTFGKWVSVNLSAANKKQLWVPPGLAHGFVALSEVAEFVYKTTDYYYPNYEQSLLWDDPFLGINWPFPSSHLIISDKDKNGILLKNLF